MKLLEAGTIAPAFTLPNQFGNSISLAEYHDSQAVVLIFYPKDATGG